MGGALLRGSVFRVNRFDDYLAVRSVRLHHLDGFPHRKLILLFDSRIAPVIHRSNRSQIRVILHIRTVLVDLGRCVRLSEIEACGKLPVDTLGDLFPIPV